MRLLRLITLALVCAGLASCSSHNPTKPGDTSSNLIAGGGRQASTDPFIGGPDESGPMSPDSILIPPDSIPHGGLTPLFYSDRDCAEAPGHRVIRNQEDWEDWWAEATGCSDMLGKTIIGPNGMRNYMRGGVQDSTPIDSGVVWPDSLIIWPDTGIVWPDSGIVWPDSGTVWPDSGIVWPDSGIVWPDSGTVWPDSGIVWPDSGIVDTVIDPWPPQTAPPIDFGQFAVVVISLESDTLYGRSLYVTEVADNGGGSVVKYLVTSFGDDCRAVLENMSLWAENSPTVAVAVPLPLSKPVAWERTDEVINCSWEPDLMSPRTLYYTDADCDLGPGEELIRDQESFDDWLDAAIECDSIRWDQHMDSTFSLSDSMGEVIEPRPTRPFWWGTPEVDFSTHAVIILRAGEQTHWGGGVWLNEYIGSETGGVVEYTVMEPGEDCPLIQDQSAINPTVAIRIPLPAGDPVSWTRYTEILNCDWPDTVWVEPGGGGK